MGAERAATLGAERRSARAREAPRLIPAQTDIGSKKSSGGAVCVSCRRRGAARARRGGDPSERARAQCDAIAARAAARSRAANLPARQ
jgi:hypothetical protein